MAMTPDDMTPDGQQTRTETAAPPAGAPAALR